MKVEGRGFLKPALPCLSETVGHANQEQYRLLQEVVQFAEALKDELVIKGQESAKEKQKVIAFVVFVRLLEIVEALIILAAYGVKEELKSLFRIFLDAYFIQANCCNDPDFIPVYFQTDEAARLKLINVAEKYQTELFGLINGYATKDIKEELDRKIKQEKIDAFNSFQFAKNVGCEEIYDSIYRVLSSAVHTTPRCLDDYVDVDENGMITAIRHGPDAETTDRITYDTTTFFLKSVSGLCELFALDKESDLKRFADKLRTGCKK